MLEAWLNQAADEFEPLGMFPPPRSKRSPRLTYHVFATLAEDIGDDRGLTPRQTLDVVEYGAGAPEQRPKAVGEVTRRARREFGLQRGRSGRPRGRRGPPRGR
jgi:hypothetical protein